MPRTSHRSRFRSSLRSTPKCAMTGRVSVCLKACCGDAMQLFVNDRFLLTAQRLKSIVLAPELGAVAPQLGVPPWDLRITFTVVDEEDRSVNIERIPPRDIRSFAHLRFPLSYIELADKFSP